MGFVEDAANWVWDNKGEIVADVFTGGMYTLNKEAINYGQDLLNPEHPPKPGEPPPLPAPPDLTDEVLREAMFAEKQDLGLGRTRKSTFLTGPLGDPTVFEKQKQILTGG
jgi:hypothetical protein